jgi:tetratricopeptide (TPR) repeat protein
VTRRPRVSILEELTRKQPNSVSAHYELGLALGASGQSALAVVALRKAVKLKPDLTHGWLALGDELMSMGDAAGADAAYAWHIKTSTHDPRLMTAAAALCANDIPQAEALLRAHLKQFPTDVAAIRMLAEVAARLRRYSGRETLLARCLELAPSFDARAAQLRGGAASAEESGRGAGAEWKRCWRQSRAIRAIAILRRRYWRGSAIPIDRVYEAVLRSLSAAAEGVDELRPCAEDRRPARRGIAAYRKSIGMLPSLGEAYWSLANLKTFRFTADDFAAMRAQLARTDCEEDRFHLEFRWARRWRTRATTRVIRPLRAGQRDAPQDTPL